MCLIILAQKLMWGGREKQTGTNQVWQDGDIRIRWKEVLRAQLGIFILPVTFFFFFIAFGTIPAFAGQTSRVRKSGERNQMEDVAKQFFTLLSPNLKYTEKIAVNAKAPNPPKRHPSQVQSNHLCWSPASLMTGTV